MPASTTSSRSSRSSSYICNRRIATVVYLATQLEKPILVEGPAGVGKTELAKVVAAALGLNLIRLQCYEGLDEAKALYEWEYAKQLLYTQILKDKISEVIGGATSLREAVDRIASQDDVFFSDRFILPRPLLRSITSAQRTVLLIDEIDKSDSEFEAFLLEVLSDFTVSVPELGTMQRDAHPDRAADQQQRARDVRRAQAPLPAPVHRLPVERAGAGDRPPQGAGHQRRRWPTQVVEAVQRVRKLDLKKIAEHQRDARLGADADPAQRRASSTRRWSRTR